MKKAFEIDWGTYPIKMHVCVGMDSKEIKEYAEGIMSKREFKRLEKDFFDIDSYEGFYMRLEGLNLLYLERWGRHEDSKTLIHELHHAVHIHLHNDRHMTNEIEALAYQMEYLYDQVVTKLKCKN